MFLLRRAAARSLSQSTGNSLAFASKPRTLVTKTSSSFSVQQWQSTASPMQRRFASNEASPAQEQTSGETVTTEPSKAEVEAKQEASADVVEKSVPTPDQSAPSTIAKAAGTVKEAGRTAANFVRRGSGQDRPSRSDAFGEATAQPSKILYIGNLFFEVKEDDLEREFERFGKVVNCRVVTDASGQSKGFGFVEFETQEQADQAMKSLHMQVFQGRSMAVQYHVRRDTRNVSRPRTLLNEPSTTLFIGNMSFQMSDKDLNNMFKEIRNVLDIRVAIDRRTGQPRGFAHADFIDVESATKAKEMLEGKEVFGRALRVDFSKSAVNSNSNREHGRRSE